MLKKVSFYLLVLLGTALHAQFIPVSEATEISILTIGPGDQLYDKFGHSAFRVKDTVNGYDIVYNYGTYNFNTPNFYTKFAQGKLLYELSEGYYEPFYKRYVAENRWIKEQQLDLTLVEKEALFEYLQTNARPQNRAYRYDFFYDNCATKIRDVLKRVLGERLQYTDDFVTETYSFRELIQNNVDANTWGSLGMDVAIGAVVDQKATAWEYQFLPDYIFKAAETATLERGSEEVPLVKNTTTLYDADREETKNSFVTSPLAIFGLIAILILFITYRDYRHDTRSRLTDVLLISITGVIGIILLLLWFATDHSATANNYNLLWAFPFNVLIAYAIAKRKPKAWVRKYVIFLLLLLTLLVIHWFTGVQAFAIGFIPLFVALAVRYLYVVSYLKKHAVLPLR